MRPSLAGLARLAVTLIAIFVAGIVGWQLWSYYMEAPWTRDGRVRAEVVGVAPDVSGLVDTVLVRDNQQVRQGEVLFRIDRLRYQLALRQAEAVVASRLATLQQAQRDALRLRNLSTVAVSVQAQEQANSQAAIAAASYQQAVADRDVAQLNLDRSEVRASVDGTITNLALRPGDYIAAGKAVMALVDAASIHVQGYFEETKLPRIHVGDEVTVRLLGEQQVLRGRVESIAGGIEDRERADSPNLLANVNPTFSWVRLAQRVPVRVALLDPPADVRLIPGRTATVIVQPQATR